MTWHDFLDQIPSDDIERESVWLGDTYYMAMVAERRLAKPKLTLSVIVQLPINQIHPVMKLNTVLLRFAI